MRQMPAVDTAQMAPLHPFELLPEARARVQRWGIRWQALQMQSRGRPIGQERVEDAAAMNRGAIPDDDHAAGHLTPQVLQAGDHSR